MKAIFVHLSGSKRGKTEYFTDPKISVGTDPSCNLNFDQSIDKSTSPFHAEINLQQGCDYVLKDLDSAKGTFVNNRQIKEVVIHDGDLIEYGDNGPRARFRIKTEKGDVCKPFREILADSMDIAREPQKGRKLITATAFFKSLLTEAFTQSSAKFKLVTSFIFLLTFIGIITLVYSIYSSLTETTKRVELLEFESAIGEKIIKDYSRGVCLIQCSFSLVDEVSGKPLKSWRDGRLLTNDLTGTGFIIGNGKILTNRHVAEPWWQQPAHAIPIEPGLTPRFEVFRAFFPGVVEPVPLRVEKVSDIADVALLSFDPVGIDIPELELDLSGQDAIEGEPVVLLGYPAGLNALYAKIDPEIAQEISKLPFLEAAQELSHCHLIKPIATQGHISDVLNKRIIYDAQTTVGGSGGPLFNNKGEVIAINYGIFRGFRGANFGVPIKYALELIEDEKH